MINITQYLNRIYKEQSQRIINNEYGMPGERFFTTRQFSEKANVSLVSSQKLMVMLSEEGLIELVGKKYFLTHGKINKSTEYGNKKTKSGLIGLHVSNLRSPFFANLAREVEININNAGYSLLITSSSYNSENEKDRLDLFRRLNVEGVISCPGSRNELYSAYSKYPVPYVFLGNFISGIKTESILVNNYPAAQKIASHMVETGCKDFIYIGLHENDLNDDIRFSGFRDGLLQAGFNIKKENVFNVRTEGIGTLNTTIKTKLKSTKEKTGVFCYHDMIAIDVINYCNKLKIPIPSLISVAGFDNLPSSETVSPQLTTISYKMNEMARMAVMLLIDKIESDKLSEETKFYIEPTLLVRGSTKEINSYGLDTKPRITDILYTK